MTNLPVKKFMVKNTVSVNPESTINETSHKMYEGHVGSALVINDDSLLGIVTHRGISISLAIFNIIQ